MPTSYNSGGEKSAKKKQKKGKKVQLRLLKRSDFPFLCVVVSVRMCVAVWFGWWTEGNWCGAFWDRLWALYSFLKEE